MIARTCSSLQQQLVITNNRDMPQTETADQRVCLQHWVITSHRQLATKTFPSRWHNSLSTVEDKTNNAVNGHNPKSDANAAGDEEQLPQLLHCAASHGLTGTIRCLLLANNGYNSNAYVDQVDRYGRAALHWAAEQGHPGATDVLLKAGACVEPRSQRMATPLMLAARNGHEDVVRLLLEAGADETDRHHPENLIEREHHILGDIPWRSTALHFAAAGGHMAVVSLLLDAGFDKQQHDGAGLMPVEIAARVKSSVDMPSSHQAVTQCLLPEDRGGTLVHAYADMIQEDVDIVAGLTKAGAFLDWQDEIGNSLLHRAAHFGHSTVAAILLRAGAHADLRNGRGGTPLHVAASKGNVAIALALLEAGADIDSRMANGRSPLHLAVVNDKVEVVKLLLSRGGYTEHKDSDRGQTPLSEASEYSLAPIIEVLLSTERADIESRSKAGLTPLHWACRFNSASGVEALLARGANPDAVDKAAAAVHRMAPSAITSVLACHDHAVRPSSRSACKLRLPVAADVIGLGDPSRFTEDPRRGFIEELPSVTARRLDHDATNRIQAALRNARYDRSWRRRGWLIILASRFIVPAVMAEGPVGGQFAVGACGGGKSGALVMVPAGKKKESLACDDNRGNRWKHEKDAVGCGPVIRSQGPDISVSKWHPQQRWNDRSTCTVQAFKRPKDGDDGVRLIGAAPDNIMPRSPGGVLDDGCCEAYIDVGEEGVDMPPETIVAVEQEHAGGSRRGLDAGVIKSWLGLAGVEVGVFRNVVLFL